MIRIYILGKDLTFASEDVARQFNISRSSAHVLCSRYVNKGLFIRLKKNSYTLYTRWQTLSCEDLFKIANALQVPSYISLMSALGFYEVTTQVQRAFIESIGQKRSIQFKVQDTSFNFLKIRKEYYFDFIKIQDIFIATKEKALLDGLYLSSFGKYTFDINSLDLKKIDTSRLKALAKRFPPKTQNLVKKICKI